MILRRDPIGSGTLARGDMAQPGETTWTVGALLQWTEQHFTQKRIESPRLDAQVLLAHVLQCERIHIYTRFTEPVGEQLRVQFRNLIQRRVKGVPVAYLVGCKEFYKLSFEVTPDVLIPRPATEALVMAAIEQIKSASTPRVFDLGTGSGCIAISIAKQRADATILGTDISPEVLQVAQRNAERNRVADRVTFLQSDLFANLEDQPPFDLIVSNPPYIASSVIETLAAEIRDHEPKLALDGGPDGFAIIDRIFTAAPAHLKPNGWLLIEIGADQELEATRKLKAIAKMKPGGVIPDGDGLPRVVTAQRVIE